MCQLLQNLIENAIKYCKEAPPHIHVSARREPGFWRFSVKDNGIGIDPQDLDSIFHPFEQLHPDTSQYAGLGLGLATCRNIVERHGGRIWVESQPGQGTAFLFSLPR
jgi:signal transduction histidine kinase